MVNPYVSIHSTTNKITCETSRKANVVTDEGKDQNGTWALNKWLKLE